MARPAGYSGTPLARKLGIREGSTVVLVGAPQRFEETLGELPGGVNMRRANRGQQKMTIWFVTSRRELERRFDAVARAVGEGTLWVAWPKKSSRIDAAASRSGVHLPSGT